MTINFNKYQFYGKVVILTITLFVVGMFLYYRPLFRYSKSSVAEFIFLAMASAFFVLFLVQMTLQLFLLPKGVQINNEEKVLKISFLFSTPTTLHLKDLIEYQIVNADTKSTRYQGVLIRITDGKEYMLGDYNLEDFKPVKTFLEENNILFVGHFEKFSFFSYFIKYLKH